MSVDGVWAEWGAWTDCTVTCGGGINARRRTCTNPEPQHYGLACPGDSTSTKVCNTNSCIGTKTKLLLA